MSLHYIWKLRRRLLQRILNLHHQVPGLQIIAAHFGGWGEWDRAAQLLPGSDILVDASSSLYLWNADAAVKMIRSLGAKNVFFGTDYPMWDPKEEVERFMNLDLTDEEKEDILWNNAARFLKL